MADSVRCIIRRSVSTSRNHIRPYDDCYIHISPQLSRRIADQLFSDSNQHRVVSALHVTFLAFRYLL